MTDSRTPGAGGPPDPGLIFSLATGYWASATLLAANELGLAAALADGEKPADEVAQAVGADARAVQMLLDACCGLGLLAKREERYALTPAAAAFLVPGRPGYLGSALRWSQDQYAAWGELAAAVQTGRPVVAPEAHLGEDPDQTRAFVIGMHERAAGVARGVLEFLPVDGCRDLLDVGGGPGTYAMLLAARHPGLRATVLDLPPVVAIAEELISGAGLSDRVTVRAGDATEATYGEESFDAILFSGVLHQMGPDTIRRMLAGARTALREGGRVVISDMMLDGTRTQPAFSTLFSLQMLLSTREGAVFAAQECAEWVRATGFQDVQVVPLPPPLPYTVVSARK